MKLYINPAPSEWENITRRPSFEVQSLDQVVGSVLQAIRERGDAALREYTERFDQVQIDQIEVSPEELAAAAASLSGELKAAIQTAKANLEKFHQPQLHKIEAAIETMPGVRCWRKSVGIEKVGLYIPGGTAPLFSTVLMLGVPAKIAGCREIVLCSPPNREGKIHPAILFAAQTVGVTRIFKAGGVQAVGAMAYGTETIPAVFKIFGPGNQYVTAAKQAVNRQGTAIDMPAGPSEVLVVADDTATPSFVAADLLAQAEHGADSQVVLVATSQNMARQVLAEVEKQTTLLPRAAVTREALNNSAALVLPNLTDVLDLVNAYAPEHLILCMENSEQFAEGVINAGSVFLGHYTPESVGDYASGTNHTLPTNGHARAYSGVSVDTFVKKITFQQLSKEGLANIGPTVEIMATAEELAAHANAVTVRLNTFNQSAQ
jgi:histidinol dehydrogenase